MNYQQIQSRAAVLASYDGWTDATPAPDWPALVNQAYDDFCWDSECVIVTLTGNTVINQAEYDLTTWTGYQGPVKTFTDVIYDTASSKKPLEWSSERAERKFDGRWLYASSGVPDRWALMFTDTLRLHPPPNAVAAMLGRAVSLPTALSSQTGSPLVPRVFHEAIAVRAAWFLGKTYAPGSPRVISYLTDYHNDIERYRDHILVHRGRAASRTVTPTLRERVDL